MKSKNASTLAQNSAATLGKLSAEKRLGHLTESERSQWGRQLGQIGRDKKLTESKETLENE